MVSSITGDSEYRVTPDNRCHSSSSSDFLLEQCDIFKHHQSNRQTILSTHRPGFLLNNDMSNSCWVFFICMCRQNNLNGVHVYLKYKKFAIVVL